MHTMIPKNTKRMGPLQMAVVSAMSRCGAHSNSRIPTPMRMTSPPNICMTDPTCRTQLALASLDSVRRPHWGQTSAATDTGWPQSWQIKSAIDARTPRCCFEHLTCRQPGAGEWSLRGHPIATLGAILGRKDVNAGIRSASVCVKSAARLAVARERLGQSSCGARRRSGVLSQSGEVSAEVDLIGREWASCLSESDVRRPGAAGPVRSGTGIASPFSFMLAVRAAGLVRRPCASLGHSRVRRRKPDTRRSKAP